ncbi:outer membrane beta-barrel protein [Elizabethkingia anophelis]|uniref:outer membrane beta-barrel protein n=1 Tax=Elizabethkingia anophelis TaxID=1117645 RepID=UPI00136F6A7B|nr:outer membrane beta-barrel protein [Elizabethkingia anophelis]MYY43897.1 PorT family protein [Elizabethkingia anophelis]
MKQVFSYLLLTISVLCYAQEKNSIRFGITAGADYSGVSNAHRPSGPRFSFQGGALALIPIGSSNQYFIQPEVVYYGAGETGKDSNFKTGDRNANGYNAVYANNYLSVPLYFKMYAFRSSSSFFAIAGPRFNFLLNQKVSNSPVDRPYYDPNYTGTTPYSGKANNFNFAFAFGVGYSFGRELEIVLKNDIGLSNTYKGLMNELSNKRKSEQVLSLGVNYIFK